ncbi:HGxxPAAW family protein [Nocardioides sp. NPDC000445]|uniref:HGxxPAAW family protein n=1 Tax=Nocardioides sp. NPDC000445 TaxID=3154257 RepID=UPI003321DD2B
MSASHGNTPAAWIAVAVGLLGFLIGSVAMMLDPISWLVFWVGVAVTVVGGLLFIVLSKLGFNVESH